MVISVENRHFFPPRVYIAPAGIGYRPRAPQSFNPALLTDVVSSGFTFSVVLEFIHKTRSRLHSVEMQIHADSKGKLLWMTTHYGPTKCRGNTVSRFHFNSALYKWGKFFTGIIFCDTRRIPAFFHPQATTLTLLDHLNPQLTAVEYYYCAKFQAIPIRSFHFIVLTYTPTHPRIN